MPLLNTDEYNFTATGNLAMKGYRRLAKDLRKQRPKAQWKA
jgi:hypothetical protein